MRGTLTPCCRSGHSYGNWQEDGLEQAWKSPEAQKFRRAIINGHYPTSDCASCHQKGSAITLRRILGLPLNGLLRALAAHNPHALLRIKQIESIFDKTELDSEAEQCIENVRQHLFLHRHVAIATIKNVEYEVVVRKLLVIVQIVESFLRGDLTPEEVAPVRQANIVALCNARCVHCPFLSTEEIVRGVPMPDGSRKKRMEDDETEAAFSCISSVIDFALNGSEFFLIKSWPKLAKKLKEEQSQLRISTNGMLLNRSNVDILVGNKYGSKLNISLDGARIETIEKIRDRVNFATVHENLRYYFASLKSSGFKLQTSFSFCLMKDNYKELPEFVDLIVDFMGDSVGFIQPSIVVQPLEMRGTRKYLDFARDQHPHYLPKDEITEIFTRLRDSAKVHGLSVGVFHLHLIDRFIELGCPIALPEIVEIPNGVGILDSPEPV